jgi:hypothetical protein
MADWTCALELNADRTIVAGSEAGLGDAIRRGADLRIYTEFLHNEHIDVRSDNPERVREVAEFGVTYHLRGTPSQGWAAGIMSLRQPIELPVGFGSRPSMSFFLYNQNGQQAIARPFLDGVPAPGEHGPAPSGVPADMPKYHQHDSWDEGSNAPSSNFIYDFDVYRFCVYDTWQEVFSNDASGAVQSGSLQTLVDAFSNGCAVKVGVRGLCADLTDQSLSAVEHEVFVQAGSCYYYTERALFIAGSHPVVRVKPNIPMRYESQGWDFGWLMLRTDGHVVYRRCDPYTLAFQDIEMRHAIRWFVR